MPRHEQFSEASGGWEQATFTAEQLRLMRFEPISWIVPEIIPAEGVTLLCSRPKFGKSWLAYDLCIGATMNRFILGEVKPMQGDVHYLALEDSKRRLKRRMTKLLPTFSGKWPEKLTITTEWRRLHEGGLDDIRAWHGDAKAKGGKPILVVIDVLAKVRKPTGNKPVYESDYEALTGLHRLSHELGVAIVVVHHTRKMAADDLMETVSGSYGLTGAVDTVIVMANKGGGAVLDVRGRDVESAELAIQFSKDTCRWTILGAAAEVHQSDQRKAIIAALVEHGGPMTIAELIAATGMKRNPLGVLLHRLVNDRAIKRVGVGSYAHNGWEPGGERVKTRKDRKDSKTGKQGADDVGQSEAPDLTASPEAPVRPVRSYRSYLAPWSASKIAEELQGAEKSQQTSDILPSYRSYQEFTSKADAPSVAAEHVRIQTERTDQTDDALSIPLCLDRRPRCAQCDGRPDGTERHCKIGDRLVFLHDECVRFYQREHDATSCGLVP